jgi:hypothetical protein
MPAVGKDSKNPHFGSRFTSLDTLIAATRAPLNEACIVITQFPAVDEQGRPVLRTVLTHGPSGEEITSDTPLYLSRNDMQGLGAAITYARRYAWAAMLGIAAEEDTDGEPAGAPEKPVEEEKVPTKRLATKKQIGLMAVLTKQLDEQNVTMPAEYSAAAEGWVDVLRQRLAEYGVAHRNELTTGQASELIDWLEQQAIPF